MTEEKNKKLINRYPGVVPFSTEQKEVFLGREKDSEALYNLVIREKITLLYAKSGLGKSSLINAGLIPILAEKSKIEPIFIRLGAYQKGKNISPKENILQKLPTSEKIDYLDKITPNKESIWYQLKKLSLNKQEKITYLLIFDQFEELFNYPEEQITVFKTALADAIYKEMPDEVWEKYENLLENNELDLDDKTLDTLESKIPVKLLFSIREDKYSLLNRITDALPDTGEHRHTLKTLNIEQAKEAIIIPAQKEDDYFSSKAFTYTPEALNKIISFLSKKEEQSIETTQLQILCNRIESLNLLEITPEVIPNFDDVFLDFYRNALEAISEEERMQAQIFVEDELIRKDNRVSLDKNICLEKVSENTLNILVNRHLLRAERNTVGGFSYEIAHDTLVDSINQAKKERQREEFIEKNKQKIKHIKRKRTRKFLAILVVLVIICILGLSYLFQLRQFTHELNKQKKKYKEEKEELENKLVNIEATTKEILNDIGLSQQDKNKFYENLNNIKDSIDKINILNEQERLLDKQQIIINEQKKIINKKNDLIFNLKKINLSKENEQYKKQIENLEKKIKEAETSLNYKQEILKTDSKGLSQNGYIEIKDNIKDIQPKYINNILYNKMLTYYKTLGTGLYGKGTAVVRTEKRDDYFILKVSYISNEILKNNYYEYIWLKVNVEKEENNIILNYQITGKYAGGLISPPRSLSDYEDIELLYPIEMKDYREKIGNIFYEAINEELK